MYPNLYYAFRDLFGVEWTFLRFVNSFGFFVAIAFIVAAFVLTSELKRKSKLGLFQPTEMQVMVGQPATVSDLVLNFLLGFLMGYKIIALFILDKSATENQQEFIFSTMGSWPAGIGMGLLMAWLKWREKNKQKLEKPERRLVRIWPQDRVGEITIIALVFGLAGAKLFDIFENWSDFLKHPSDYIFSAKGLTFYGGLICAALAIWWYAKKHKIGFWHLNDAMSPTMMVAYAVGRIGCQVSGDGDWGIENTRPNPYSWLPDWAWAYNYPHNVNEVGVPIPGCTDGKYCTQLEIPVFPTPLYEIIFCLALFGILWMLRKRIKTPGVIFAIYLMFNGFERFMIEKIRVNVPMDVLGFHPTQAEIISSLLFLSGLTLFIWLRRKKATEKSTSGKQGA